MIFDLENNGIRTNPETLKISNYHSSHYCVFSLASYSGGGEISTLIHLFQQTVVTRLLFLKFSFLDWHHFLKRLNSFVSSLINLTLHKAHFTASKNWYQRRIWILKKVVHLATLFQKIYAYIFIRDSWTLHIQTQYVRFHKHRNKTEVHSN